MCDYSLMGVPNRLARDGEELTSHRFPGGTIGLVSCDDLRPRAECQRKGAKEFCKRLWNILTASAAPIPAVCVPPGSRLFVAGIPYYLQKQLGCRGVEAVVFTQITAERNSHRDALRFANGREVLLQRFAEGLHVLVLETTAEERAVVSEEGYARLGSPS